MLSVLLLHPGLVATAVSCGRCWLAVLHRCSPPLCIELHCLCAFESACSRPGGDSRDVWQVLAVLYRCLLPLFSHLLNYFNCAVKCACCRPGGDSRELWQALAVLYKGQGRPDLSLAVYLQLQLPSVFDFIKVGNMLS
jgi:hypothetical protein